MIADAHRVRLRELASRSIDHGIRHGCPISVDVQDWPPSLREIRSSFVTLFKDRQLRGCIGGLTATDPLVTDVANHAYRAAFKDPRFDPLDADEFGRLEIHLSVLSAATPLACDREQDLIDLLRPGIDGVTIRQGGRQGTFLPSVWENLPDPGEFVAALKQKAGFARDYWSPAIRVERYTTESW